MREDDDFISASDLLPWTLPLVMIVLGIALFFLLAQGHQVLATPAGLAGGA
ncbi:MAG: hypothetical protein AB7I33_10815 [Gemmatimonadales bacterium]